MTVEELIALYGAERVAKHLIGRHEQDDHDPTRKRNPRLAEAKAPHRRKDHRTKKDAERHKARVRRVTRRIGEVTGLGATAFVADIARRVSEGADPEQAVKDAGKTYKKIGQAIANSGKKIFGKSDGFTDEEDDMDYTLEGEFSKFEDDEKLAFGWASITKMDGEPVIDRQGDFITTGDLEKSAYEYVLGSRVGGEMHRKELVISKAGSKPKQVATLVESMVFTPEKIAKMGLPDDFPEGWWVGFKVQDDEVWKSVKGGKYNSFSIHGVGKRTPIRKTDIIKQQLAKGDTMPSSLQELIDKYGASRVAKHLIGSHDQKKHDPTKEGASHTREQHGTSSDPGALTDTQRRERASSLPASFLSMNPVGMATGLSGAEGTTLAFEDNWGQNLPFRGNRQIMESDAASLATRGGISGALTGGILGGTRGGARGAAIGALGSGLLSAGLGGMVGAHSDKTREERGARDTRTFDNSKRRKPFARVNKADRRRQVLADLGNVAKADVFHSQLDLLAAEISELRKRGEIDREFDIPVDEAQYEELSKYFSEEVADSRYDGEWMPFEDYIGAVSDVVKSQDEQAWQILASYL